MCTNTTMSQYPGKAYYYYHLHSVLRDTLLCMAIGTGGGGAGGGAIAPQYFANPKKIQDYKNNDI